MVDNMRISKILLPSIIPATLLLNVKLASALESYAISPPFPHLLAFSVLAIGILLPLLIGSIAILKRGIFDEPEPSPGLGWQSEPEPSPGLGWQSEPEPSPGLGWQSEPEPSPGLGWQ